MAIINSVHFGRINYTSCSTPSFPSTSYTLQLCVKPSARNKCGPHKPLLYIK